MIDRNIAERLRREGATYEEIGAFFGVTRQRICNFLNQGESPRKNANMIERIPYKGLHEFMSSNRHLTVPKLTVAIMGAHDRAAQAKVYRFLAGDDAALPRRVYDRLI